MGFENIEILGLSVYFIIFDFFIFCFAGWIYESTFVSIRDKKLVNRGFLIGPYLPLYGFGAVSVYLLLRPFAKIPTLLYVMGMVVATVLEYITSWLLEVCFHAQWWDYSKEPYNFQGRIALIPSMFWGILSLIMFDLLQPVATRIIEAVPKDIGRVVVLGIVIVMSVDTVFTVINAINFRKQLENLYAFKKEIEEMLEDVQLRSVREFLADTKKELSEKIPMATLIEKRDLLYSKLKDLRKEPEKDSSKLATFEERVKGFWENRVNITKRHPFTGNQRLLDAFPTMKLHPKGQKSIDVRELLLSIKKKTDPLKEKLSRNKE